ncbi:MAG TPA: class I SAM-dependent methyltransferase [Alphaproteobacteria bacterium]|nr:class I SAM-dependent methyltransferase [Alphaproteobacteria bacterium]
MRVWATLFDVLFHATMRAADRAFDWRYGVETTVERRYAAEEAMLTRHGDPETNMPSYYLRLWALRRFLAPGPDDVFADLGCGSGRTLFVFARAGVRCCRGIEFYGTACRLAARNVAGFGGKGAPVEIIHADIADYAFDDETVLFLFNPFGRATLRAVLENLRASLLVRPRRVRIGYYHPVHADLLDATPWLRRGGLVRGFKTNIAVYETRPLTPSNLV